MAEKVPLRWTLIAMCGFAAGAHAADELESLDADFLAYLAEFEGDEDDWTIVGPPADTPAKPAATAPKTTESKTPPQPSKAAQPAKTAPPAEESKR